MNSTHFLARAAPLYEHSESQLAEDSIKYKLRTGNNEKQSCNSYWDMATWRSTKRASVLLMYIVVTASLFQHSRSTNAEGEALVNMMNEWSVEFPTWIRGDDPCSAGWEYVGCSDGRVTQLNLTNKQLKGSLSSHIGNLDRLTYLDISSNVISGKFPTTFMNCRRLLFLNISFNEWKISFPEEVVTLPQLEVCDCRNCALIGGLPDMGQLGALKHLNLMRNSLTGGIPTSWHGFTKMEKLLLWGNLLLGEFPEWIFKDMPNLKELTLTGNQFYGEMKTIAVLDFEYNITAKFDVLRWDCNYLEGYKPCQLASAVNNCSSSTYSKLTSVNEASSPFSFENNCYTGASDLSDVDDCEDHSLSCNDFQSTVVLQRGCPEYCPPSQTLQCGATADTGCPCGTSGCESGSSVPLGAVVGGVLGLVLVFAVILGFILWKRRKHFNFLDTFQNKKEADEGEWVAPAGIQRFTVEELARITSDFNDDHVIGQGGFGKVYHGTLDDGREVAIKRAGVGSLQGSREFRNEVTLLSRLHHRHLVRLEGFCAENDFQVLVYEFMREGNLQDNLYGPRARLRAPLTWNRRLEIAYGVAQGLEYLHSFADPPVIHRDVKPSNILLDDYFVAKLADFGISKENLDLDTHVSTRPAGTPGFLDPEYYMRSQLTTASDVYAYGMVLLELITGRMAIDNTRLDELSLVEWVKKRFLPAGVVAIIDSAIEYEYSADACKVITELALQCAEFSRNGRPSMKEVLSILESVIDRRALAASSIKESEWLGKCQDLPKDLMTMDSEATSHIYTQGSSVSNPGYLPIEVNPR